jgi:hypothetical protein
MKSKFKGCINRLEENKVETLGRFYFYKGIEQLFSCVVLELPDRSNQNSISRICGGVHICKKRWSKKYGWHYHVTDVEGRKLILIHFGNYYTNTRGCILFGRKFADINKDGYKDITSSKNTIDEFMSIAPDEWELTINDI